MSRCIRLNSVFSDRKYIYDIGYIKQPLELDLDCANLFDDAKMIFFKVKLIATWLFLKFGINMI